MSAITPGSNSGSLNGATPVELVAAPTAGVTRVILSLTIANVDNAVVTLTLRKKIASTNYQLDYRDSLPINETWGPLDNVRKVMLTGTTQSITALMSGAAGSTNPTFEVCWIDRS